MIDRYNLNNVFINKDDLYESFRIDRDVKIIKQFSTVEYSRPDDSEYSKIKTVKHIWAVGDKYYKLANEYYGDPKDWWLIARFNSRPTEAHNKIGDIILIPTRIEEVKRLFKI